MSSVSSNYRSDARLLSRPGAELRSQRIGSTRAPEVECFAAERQTIAVKKKKDNDANAETKATLCNTVNDFPRVEAPCELCHIIVQERPACKHARAGRCVKGEGLVGEKKGCVAEHLDRARMFTIHWRVL